MSNTSLNVVWFKRDLRVQDHAPLLQAAEAGRALPLYIVEPELWAQADASGRQWMQIRDSLLALREALAGLGQPLLVRSGDPVDVFADLHRSHGLARVHSHQECGNGWTYARDRRVAGWLRQRGIPWQQLRQFGVVRGMQQRERWASQWEQLMGGDVLPAPPALSAIEGLSPGPIPDWPCNALVADDCPGRQAGGRAQALDCLHSFLEYRGARYHREMSSPLSAEQACSRLSVHLATGALSVREVVHANRSERERLRGLAPALRGERLRALAAFESRLHWHCHFIQKLESEPEIEFNNINRGYDGMREPHFERARFNAWASAQTGWPFVDACMASLQQTGWINFRMRAMLVAVAAYHLWLHWREPSLHLARLFSDYEPGIHYSQCQMQSGVTGINVPRIYNPLKQSHEQDPQGLFIRRWLPALAAVPDAYIHSPWLMPAALQRQTGCVLDKDYPMPIRDHEVAAREGRQRLAEWRRQPGLRELSAAVMRKHGSRKRRARSTAKTREDKPQGELF